MDYLKHDKHNITEALNGFHALQILAEKEFDVVLMDIQMPVMDGLEATEVVRACERGEAPKSQDIPAGLSSRVEGKYLPIIALTAHATKKDMEQCLEAGMDAYLTKPLQPEQLTNTLAEFVGAQEEEEVTGPEKETGKAGGKSLKLKIKEHLSETYHIGPDKIDELVSSSLVTLCDQIATCRKDIKSMDLISLEKSAHTLKGSLVNLGFSELGAIMAKLEKDAGQGAEGDYLGEFDKLEEELAELFI